MRIDLHVHSNASDGAQNPADVVGEAKKAGLDAFALTDHDTLAGLPEARAAASLMGLKIYTGCEVSAVYEEAPVHVLGYFMDESHPRLLRELALIRDDRVERAQGMVAKLRDLGVDVTWEQVRGRAKGESVARPHVAAAMVEAGAIRAVKDAFTEEWIGEGGRAYVEKKALTPQGAVDLIREAGGAAVLAHPVWFKKDTDGLPGGLITSLADHGLAGIEVHHPDHDEAAVERFGSLARDLGLIGTGSSDYHGNEHGPVIAVHTTAPDALEALRERAGR